MKIIYKIILSIFLVFSFFVNTNAWFFDELLGNETPIAHPDCWGEDCNIDTWVKIVKETVNWIETERSASEYIQDIVAYLLTFISIIAVIYIIYAWFRILTSAWDEETVKKQKQTIMYVVIWILVIWLAYPIMKFIIDLVSK